MDFSTGTTPGTDRLIAVDQDLPIDLNIEMDMNMGVDMDSIAGGLAALALGGALLRRP